MSKRYDIVLPEGYVPPQLPGRDEWLTALRSGKYKQGHGWLHDPLQDSYCCLGVLLQVQGKLKVGSLVHECLDIHSGSPQCNKGLSGSNPLHKVLKTNGELPPFVRVKLYDHEYSMLTTLNDGGFTFEEIADIIERVWSA